MYCKFGNFRENFFSRIVVKDIFATIKDRVISPFREDFIFTKLRKCEVSRK